MKRIIITGASSGLGYEFAKLCILQNIEIINISRTKPDLDCIHIETDLMDEDSVKNTINIINSKYSNFDALINCAGVGVMDDPLNYKKMEQSFIINVAAPIFLFYSLLDKIIENTADVLNVGSTIAFKAYENQTIYGSSKWALRGANQTFSEVLKKTKSRLIQFNPGGMNTVFFEKSDGVKRDFVSDFMDPKEIAKAMFWTLNMPKNIEISEIIINRK